MKAPVFVLAVLGQACCYGALLLLGDLRNHVPEMIGFFAACFLLYLLTLRLLLAKGDAVTITNAPDTRYLLAVLIAAFMFRCILWPSIPSLSDDIYRYVWEGKVVANGLNPFALAPEASGLAHLRDAAIYPLVTRPHLTAIYPPLVQLIFAAASAASYSVMSLKTAFILFDIATMGLLLLLLAEQRLPRLRVAVYALNPLVIVEFSGSGHLDSAGIFFMTLSLYLFIRRRKLLPAATLALAFLVKLLPVLLLPLLARRRKFSTAAVFTAVAAAGLLPFLDAGRGLYATLTVYADNWLFNGSLFNLLFFCIPDNQDARRVGAALFCLCAAGFYYRVSRKSLQEQPDAVFHQCLFILGLAFAFTPVLHPWYVCWMVPLLAIVPNRAWLLFSGLVFSAYWVLDAYAATGQWRESPAVLLLEYLPLYGLLLYDYVRAASKKAHVKTG